VPSPPDRTDLWAEGTAQAPVGHDHLRLQPARPRLRAWLDRWLVRGISSRPRHLAKAKAPTLADLWNALAVAELECAIALRAWQLAPRRDKQAPYEAYRGALEREAMVAGELRLRVAP
jgi:hypothetical protein